MMSVGQLMTKPNTAKGGITCESVMALRRVQGGISQWGNFDMPGISSWWEIRLQHCNS